MHIHATEYDRTGGNPNQQVYDIEREGMESADCIIAVSELTRQKISKYYGIPLDKIKVVHNAIDQFSRASDFPNEFSLKDKIVLFLGRLTIQKGADYLLEAAEKALRHESNIKFVFVGDGDMINHLIQQSIDLGIEQKVMFTGFMEHEEVDKAYQMADLYVMPSVSEPFGITALESIKNGTPVIVSKQSGVAEVIHNALKVDFWDTDELANQIVGLVKHRPLADLIAQNASQELDHINWDTQASKIVEIYNQMLS
jgi:glycosyltransferase involved in cell wall biosynthesis